jgi:hypothetical protein
VRKDFGTNICAALIIDVLRNFSHENNIESFTRRCLEYWPSIAAKNPSCKTNKDLLEVVAIYA